MLLVVFKVSGGKSAYRTQVQKLRTELATDLVILGLDCSADSHWLTLCSKGQTGNGQSIYHKSIISGLNDLKHPDTGWH